MVDQIEQVRAKIDIVELINSYLPLKKAGRNFKALCPFHSEKTPSFVVSPERQIYKCFGCGQGGSVFNFLIEYEKMDFGEALRFLADKAGIKLVSFQPTQEYREKEKLLQINHLTSEFYHYILLSHRVGKKALSYLLSRGISQTSMKTFKLGYAPASWENLQTFLVRKKGYQPFDLEKAGLIIASSKFKVQSSKLYYDRFRSRIIFPLFDHRSNVVGFSGRTLEADLQGAKYINTPETVLYHKGDLFYGLNTTKTAIKEKNQAIIVEGEFDLISSYQAGVKNVVAIKGTALTENQVALIKRFTENIVLSLDEDSAGDAAARRGIEIADEQGLNIRVIQLQYGKDPDECARHEPKLWRKSTKTTQPIYDFYLQSALKRFGKQGPESKKEVSEELVPIIAKITNEVVKAHYVKKLAGVLDVGEEAVLREINRWEKLKQTDLVTSIRKKPGVTQPVKTRREMLEEILLALVLQAKDKNKWLKKIELPAMKNNAIVRILTLLRTYLSSHTTIKINEFTRTLAEELIPTLDQAYLKELEFDTADKIKFDHEFSQTKHELEKIYLRERLNELIAKSRILEQKDEESSSGALQEELKQISQRLKDLV